MEELNQRAIHQLYHDGEFEPVIEVLESFQKRNPRFSFSDSVFIAKHLAVVYTATPETRERGRYYMMRLLELVPSAKLVDMFVSDEIERVFERVREEFQVKQRGFGLDTLTITVSDYSSGLRDTLTHDSTSQSREPGWSRQRNWIIAGAGLASLAALGTATYFYFDRSKRMSNPPEVRVPKENTK